MAINEQRLEALMEQMVGHMTGSTVCMGIWIGDETGLYRAMAGAGALGASEIAQRAGCHPRLVREWLDGQAAAGLVAYDAQTDSYRLDEEAALILADECAPTFVARAMNALGSMFTDIDKISAAFQGDGKLGWGEHHQCLFKGTEWFFRPGYKEHLPSAWIPALDGVEDKLRSGATVADIGCGHGASCIALTEAFPNARIHGFDFHEPSVRISRERAAEAGVSERVQFDVADAKSYDGQYDLICFFDCLHDMGDPVGAARHARAHLAEDGAVLLVEPFAIDGRANNIRENPMAALLYHASATICTPNSLSQEVGLGLGAQAGEKRTQQVFAEAGYARFRRAAETPLNLIYEARP